MKDNVDVFIILIGCLFFLTGVYYWLIPKIKIKSPKLTKGIIISVDTAVPEQMKKNNSKWALIEITINDKRYISLEKLQVSMNNKIGDFIEVIYDEKDPENMVIKKRNYIAIMFVLIGMVLIIYKIFLKR